MFQFVRGKQFIDGVQNVKKHFKTRKCFKSKNAKPKTKESRLEKSN